jgi:hypothetical protein
MNILSDFSWRFMRVWWRNLVVYRRIWKVNFLVPLFEPALYILKRPMPLLSAHSTRRPSTP